jgi:Nif-specific regulatory protein
MSSLKEQIREIEKEEIIRALKECDWVMARAARMLGITERMIGYKIKKYEIRKESDSMNDRVHSEAIKE